MRRVLVVRFGALGDVVLTLPVFESLRQGIPGVEIAVAVKARYADLFAAGGEDRIADRVFPLGTTETHRGVGGFRRYAKSVSEFGADRVLDLHGSLRSRLLTALLSAGPGAPKVTRVRLGHFRRRALVSRKTPLFGYPGHAVERYLAVVDRLGIPRASAVPHLRVPAAVGAAVAGRCRRMGMAEDRAWVALAPGAGRATKRWPAARFGALAKCLVEEGFAVAVIGAEEESLLVEEVRSGGGAGVFGFTGIPLLEHAALLSRARCLVTNDSGLMHLAVAVGTPVVAIFGSTTVSLGFRPLGPSDRVLSVPLDCRPCSLHGLERCPRGDLACLSEIGVDRVLDSVAAVAGRAG